MVGWCFWTTFGSGSWEVKQAEGMGQSQHLKGWRGMVSWLLGVMLVWSVVYERRAFATGIKGHEEQFRCNGPRQAASDYLLISK